MRTGGPTGIGGLLVRERKKSGQGVSVKTVSVALLNHSKQSFQASPPGKPAERDTLAQPAGVNLNNSAWLIREAKRMGATRAQSISSNDGNEYSHAPHAAA